MKKKASPTIASSIASLRAAGSRNELLQQLAAVNKDLSNFIISLLDINDEAVLREVLLRTIAQLSHQSNIAVGIAVAAGLTQMDVEKAVEVGSRTASANLAQARAGAAAAEKEPT